MLKKNGCRLYFIWIATFKRWLNDINYNNNILALSPSNMNIFSFMETSSQGEVAEELVSLIDSVVSSSCLFPVQVWQLLSIIIAPENRIHQHSEGEPNSQNCCRDCLHLSTVAISVQNIRPGKLNMLLPLWLKCSIYRMTLVGIGQIGN